MRVNASFVCVLKDSCSQIVRTEQNRQGLLTREVNRQRPLAGSDSGRSGPSDSLLTSKVNLSSLNLTKQEDFEVSAVLSCIQREAASY